MSRGKLPTSTIRVEFNRIDHLTNLVP
ncbi:hypothetical protein J8M21_25760 [Pseudoalteromonas luteoviolacea]|nr:hypothetical protein [Pseudoalteromonas luteoviolacea]MBQ4909651.1 hypothetical protein [Pseudoalteromonas luteoviolacea]